MADKDIKHLAPSMQDLAREFLAACAADPVFKGCRVFITQTYRCAADQNADYAKGRNAAGVVINKKAVITNAKYGESPHNCVDKHGNPAALAFDFAIEDMDGALDWDGGDALWSRAISIGTLLGLVSGAKFAHLVDEPHFELAHWKNT